MDTNTLAANENESTSDLTNLQRKTHYTGTVLKTTLAGAIVDIGLSVPGVVHISQLAETPVNRVEDVVKVGQSVEVWVRGVYPKKGRVELTMVRPLDLEWREIQPGMVVKGKVTKLERYGAFVDIGAERPGLVHISEMTHDYIKDPGDIVKEGDEVEVQVLEVNRRKRQIRLSMKALEEPPVKVVKTVEEQASPRERGKPREPKESKESKEAEGEVKEMPVPTAMEVALREAVERSKTLSKEEKIKSKRKGPGSEMEQILSRTLQQKRK